jgi:hypothetical protein
MDFSVFFFSFFSTDSHFLLLFNRFSFCSSQNHQAESFPSPAEPNNGPTALDILNAKYEKLEHLVDVIYTVLMLLFVVCLVECLF